MLEVNNFDSIRVALASPEQIRGWSKGEVTKPETINYRTLKPEKDGLFDERIFGPTRDWECYCGKYKRIRYKGIICDKCGVEVTRSKVRRERMGHIQLASPVSHIWYFKGTPSRLATLLEISPRNLEKVLYFAQYIVTSVDEDARKEALKGLDDELAGRGGGATAEEESEINARLKRQLTELEREVRARLEQVESDRAERAQAMGEAAQVTERAINDLGEEKADGAIVFETTAEIIVADGALGGKEGKARLRAVLTQASIDDEQNFTALKESIAKEGEQKKADLKALAEGEVGALRANAKTSAQSRKEEIAKEKKALLSLKAFQLLPEIGREDELDSFRTLDAKFGSERPRGARIFRAGMGAEAVRELIERMDLDAEAKELAVEVRNTAGMRRKKAIKRLRLLEAFRRSGARPEWMIMSVLPVIPPDLRPMVQLDGGRFATSDLNDLYRRVINRNNRLKRLIELGAPEIIVRNEKRMLQEAVDALIDNGRRGRAISGTGNHRLKSLSDMLKGKQGRFRQNLLGKRVDYSGRSVIVVGPELKLHECGIPKKMALELFKPFVMRQLVELGHAHNIKSAKRLTERATDVVWEVLADVIKDHPVLLNRAPTLHRLGIQAFMPVLVEGSAIRIHPLVCTAFNADFDGDQMAVHVPLSEAAQQEARELMLSSNNLLSPADGTPIVSPTQDMVLGCFYLTQETTLADGAKRRRFSDETEALLAYDLGQLAIHAPIDVVAKVWDEKSEQLVEQRIETTIGRVKFNEILPDRLRFVNRSLARADLRELISRSFQLLGKVETALLADGIKRVGFEAATRGGMTISVFDIAMAQGKKAIIAEADKDVAKVDGQYTQGLITDEERYKNVIRVWQKATGDISTAMMEELNTKKDGRDPQFHPLLMMTNSGARGNKGNIGQLGAMRGLMADPSGRIIDVPVKSNFREGMTVLEYFISTHGARKGLADTALRTADSGYLTRRLVDVAQDVIVRIEDCGTAEATHITLADTADVTGTEWPIAADHPDMKELRGTFARRLLGRIAAEEIKLDASNSIMRGEEINEAYSASIAAATKVDVVAVRSPLSCVAPAGVCQACYGRNLATGKLIEMGESVGIMAAQSIGEPGTQLTMRTFHTGGVAGLDITAGLPRVEELFEARKPKGKAEISRIDGVVEVIRSDAGTIVEVTHSEKYEIELDLPIDAALTAREGDLVEAGQLIGTSATTGDLTAPVKGLLVKSKDGLVIRAEDVVPASKYPIPHNAKLLVKSGDRVRAGDPLTDGPLDPQELLEVRGRAEVQNYLVKEVQKVYRSQGVTISDKHIEIIVRQLLRKVRVDNPGDTHMLPTELADRLAFERENARVLAEGGEPATAAPQLLGVTKASLNTESFLAAASFQETTRVLTEAAITGARDYLVGLKENVIIGKLIPAGTGAPDKVAARKEAEKLRAAAALAGGDLPTDFGKDDFNVFLESEEGGASQDDVSQLVALLTEEKPAAEGETEENPFLADAAEAPKGDEGGA
ncbi:MAG: DNA-directed RNA polymerase subunit beta' [Chloroflexi bacterium]|nr:DNA-directed RNA polymerase subunit beta' [Chloroflexota bacterium]